MKTQEALYRGKAKTLWSTEDPNYLVMEFRDDTSAFDGVKVEKLQNKGKVNNQFNAYIMQRLMSEGIKTQFKMLLNDTQSLVKHLKMLPIECVIRNVTAGSICKRLGVAEGIVLEKPTFEFFLKNDELHDPMINESHILSFEWADQKTIDDMKKLTFEINTVLKNVFADANMILVDYKVEFGYFGDELLLGDEFTPDGCRIWDADTKAKMDKDRFRQELGSVVDAYREVADRLGVELN